MRHLYRISFIIFICIISFIIVYLCSQSSSFQVVGYGIALTPLIILALSITLVKPYYAYIGLFLANYFVLGISRYINSFPSGIAFDCTIVITFASLIIQNYKKPVEWKAGINIASILALIWMLYCLLELFNPQAISNAAWFASIRGVAIHFFAVVFLTCIIFDDYKSFRQIMMIWGTLAIIGTCKALIQKFIGFDSFEKVWLYRDGGYVTHIISSGIRYFSFFSDASNFGATMGHALIVFLGLGILEKEKSRRIFYFIVAFAGLCSLLLSGTRSALAVPIVGFAVYVILSKNARIILPCAIVLIAIFIFFRFTDIGQSNSTIRRVRSAFYATEDASFLVRLKNQAELKKYMEDKPFGAGIGHGGVKAKKNTNNSYLSQIPTDSWFVMLWVETGRVGLILNITIWLVIIGSCGYIILFKLKNPLIRGQMSALLSGVVGILVASYANEILGQFPNGVISYACIAFIYTSLKYEKQLELQV